MAPATGTALLLLAVFVLPGFVALLIRERTFTVPHEQSAFERLLNALYYAAISYAVAVGIALGVGMSKGDLIALYSGRAPLWQLGTAAVLVVLVIPATIADAGRRWRHLPLRERVLTKLGIRWGTVCTPAGTTRLRRLPPHSCA